jgi:hypothetical protein
MLLLTFTYCGGKADETELSLGYKEHLKRLRLGPLAEAFTMWRFREGQFIDESVAAGVAH